MNRACLAKNTNLHEQNQHASSIRPIKSNFVRMKKVIKITGILVCMAVLFLNVSLNHKSSTGDLDLSKLITANKADAECFNDIPELNNGRCSYLTGNCYWDWPQHQECDSSRW